MNSQLNGWKRTRIDSRQPIQGQGQTTFHLASLSLNAGTHQRHRKSALKSMESLYARDTPTAQDRKKLTEQVMADQVEDQVTRELSSQEQPTETLEGLMETSTESNTEAATSTESTNATDDAFGFNFSALPREELEETQPQLDEQWQTPQAADLGTQNGKVQQESQETDKTEEGRLAELSTEKIETPDPMPEPQPRRTGVASVPRKSKPAITINTGSSAGVGSKRPPPTPVSPPTFSWNDILRVQNLIERCLQQYLSKNDILMTLKEQANVDPAFTNVVWQKLEEQNPTFFRAYSLQLQLKEQIIAFNYLVGQQKEMAEKGGKRFLHYNNRSSASRASASCSLITAPTTTTLPPISMDARTFLRTPIRSAKRTPSGKFACNQHMNMYQLGNSSVGLSGTTSGMTTLPPPSPLPLPSPIKTDLDTHAFFT